MAEIRRIIKLMTKFKTASCILKRKIKKAWPNLNENADWKSEIEKHQKKSY